MNSDQAERLITAVERIANAAETLVQGQQRKTSSPAKFIKPIEEFPGFDWDSIGAKVDYRDNDHIVAGVSWRGATYERKQKHGDVWFSRNIGKDEEDNPIYETLIKFAANVVPNSLPSSMVKSFVEQSAPVQELPAQQAPQPISQPTLNSKPKQYPQHNALIKSIRNHTGHTSGQVVAWCQQHNVVEPSQLTPELCQRLAQCMAIGWGSKQFDSPESCTDSYNQRVRTLVASGVKIEDAIADWIDSVKKTPVRR